MGLTRKQKMMLIVLIFGTFVTVLNQTVVTPALPAIMSEMGVSAAEAQWLTTGFTLVNAIMIPVTAYLTDRFSTKSLFVTSMLIFTCGSILAGAGPNFVILLLGRLVQAAGAGILMPMGMTVLMRTFPVEKRGTAMGLFGVVIAFAPNVATSVDDCTQIFPIDFELTVTSEASPAIPLKPLDIELFSSVFSHSVSLPLSICCAVRSVCVALKVTRLPLDKGELRLSATATIWNST